MYQLSHLLIEQRNILSTLREQNSTDDTKGALMGDGPENGNAIGKIIPKYKSFFTKFLASNFMVSLLAFSLHC